MGTSSRTWGLPKRSPFELPRGRLGRLAGHFMLWTNKQDDMIGLLGVRPGERVLEVGYGPGGLIRCLTATPAARVCGVDPSPEMRDMAGRHESRAELRIGTADHTGFGDAEFDCVVSVNNVALWPDLEAGLRELRRVTRPGGRVVIAWHGGAQPSRITCRLMLPPDRLECIQCTLGRFFSDVSRHELSQLTVFLTHRPRS